MLFRRTPAREFAADLYELAPDGTVTTLARTADLLGDGDDHLSDAEKARRERTRTATRGVVEIGVSEDGSIVHGRRSAAQFFLIDRARGSRTTIDPQGAAYDPRLSPDGTRIAFVRDGDLWTTSAGQAPVQWTHHGPDGIEYGVADFAAQEELGRTRGFWWSPDSHVDHRSQRTDTKPIDTLYVSRSAPPRARARPVQVPARGHDQCRGRRSRC